MSVNAAIPENQERAYLVRMRDAMNDLGVPEELQRRVREYVEAETHPRARTLALFAAEDRLFMDYRLHVDVPESFGWGTPASPHSRQSWTSTSLTGLWLRARLRDITAEECPFCGQKTRVRPLSDILVDLAAARGARLDFVRGENENTDTLRDEFGGVAGLTRF